MTTRTIATWLATAAAVLTATVVLAGCGSNAAHNQADIDFAQGMIPHHQQAVQMSTLAAQRASSLQVKDLAAGIQGAQQPEIDQMQGMLKAWDAPKSGGMNGMSGMKGMDHSNMPGMSSMRQGSMNGMPGMMSDADMQQLGQASGAPFDTMFLKMMISHHQGAVTMSQTEQNNGKNPDAKALAQRIIDAQQREITQMQNMLAGG